LGLFLSNDCSWDNHFKYIKDKARQRLNITRSLKFKLDRKALECIYTSFIRPLLEYGDIIIDNCTQRLKDELESIQLEAARIVTGATQLVSHDKLYQEIGWLPLAKRRYIHKLILFYKIINGRTPLYLLSIVPSHNQIHEPEIIYPCYYVKLPYIIQTDSYKFYTIQGVIKHLKYLVWL